MKIAKFLSLAKSDVAEQFEITDDAWLNWLAAEPADEFTGQMDHGGWSPVVFDPPKRSRENVREVFALVLDHDKDGDWDRLRTLWRNNQGVIYTTKSHGASGLGSRLRVVLVLARTVSVDEHSKIWDWAARRSSEAGCPADKQCRDASRFWYDPTRPPGGWRSEILNGVPIEPDPILKLEEAPKLRVVQAPVSVPASDREKRAAAYLDKIPGAVSGQAGHTATFNAVAAMMFGFDLDEHVTKRLVLDHYNQRCNPPWSEREIDHKISSVSQRCTRERGYLLAERSPIVTAQDAAHRAPEAPAELDVDWTSRLQTKKDRTPRRGYNNVLVFVRHHPEYRGKWSLNTMTGDVWFDGHPMPETFAHDIRADIDRRLGFSPGRDDVDAAIATAANDRQFHPVQQYLRSIDWDNKPRLRRMAFDYLGSNSPLHADLVKKWMISAVARALNPGCKVDTALMLYGEQGYFKSTFFAILGGAWHADSPIDITNKDSFQQIHAAWVYEFAELENVVTGRAESRLKAWLTSTHDMFRAPYRRAVERRPRSCVICGTTNRRQFLTDDTGSRRFWIVPVARVIPRELLAANRDQLWAEAVAACEAGEEWWLNREAENEREIANADYSDDDPWQDAIEAYLVNPVIESVTASEILTHALKLDLSRQDHSAKNRVARSLARMGWKLSRPRHDGSRPRLFTRPDVV